MGLICKVRFEAPFVDGAIIKRKFRMGEIVELDAGIVNRIIASGGEVEILERRVPQKAEQ